MFPKKKYAPTGGHVIAIDAAHERALGDGWQDNPPAPAFEPEPEPEIEAEPEPEPAPKKKGR